MRVCGTFPPVHDLSCSEQRPEPDRMSGELIGAALLPIHDADGGAHPQAGLPKGRDGLQRGPSRGDDVLDEADRLALLELALEAVPRPVRLRLGAHDHEGETRGQRGRGGQRDGAELGACQPRRIRLGLAYPCPYPASELAEQLRPRLEAVLVEVIARAAAGAEHEVALEQRVAANRLAELVVGHARPVAAIALPARASMRRACGVPRSSDSIEPSP